MRTVDSDVVVLAIHWFESLGLSELWICFGSGKKIRDIPIHVLSSQIGDARCKALILFYALTGCDTVSHFLGCGKKTAWSAWQNTSDLTDALIDITSDPKLFNQQYQNMKIIERFFCGNV